MAFAVWISAVLTRWLDAPVPVVTHRAADHFIVTFDAVEQAVSYEFTTDGSLTWLPILSGVDVTTDSAGAALVESTHYPVQVHSVGVGGSEWDTSEASEIVDAYTNPALPPTLMLLTPQPTDDPAIWIMRGLVVAFGGDVVTITFQYGATIAYGTNVVLAGTYTTGERVVKGVKVAPETTYHIRMKGENMGGITYTADAILFTGRKPRWRVYERQVT
jgi:hypothetical protein